MLADPGTALPVNSLASSILRDESNEVCLLKRAFDCSSACSGVRDKSNELRCGRPLNAIVPALVCGIRAVNSVC